MYIASFGNVMLMISSRNISLHPDTRQVPHLHPESPLISSQPFPTALHQVLAPSYS